MMKRYLTMLIALMAIVMGAKAATDYGFKIGGAAINSDNYESVSQGQAWYYVPAENVLYLTDGIIYGFNHGKVIEINSDKNPSLKICVQGDCTLKGIVNQAVNFIGEGHHEIYGSGILRINPDKTGAKGINSEGNTYLTIKDVTIDIRVWSGFAIDSRSGFKEITIDNSEISMQTGDGYAWINQNTTVKLRRCYVEGGKFDYSSRGGIVNDDGTWTHDSTIKRSLWDFNLTVNEPVAGGTVSNSCQFNGTGCEVEEVKWNKLLEGGYFTTENEGSVFQMGSTYEVIIRILANDGERIASRDDCVATINGKPAEIYNSSDKFIVMHYTFPQLADTYYDVWVGGKQVNNINKSDVLGDGKVSFIKNIFGKYVLILENATITNTGNPDYEFTGYGRGIYTKIQGLNIRVKGNNTIESKGEGIYFNDNLEISGTTNDQGKLSVKGSFGIRPERAKVTTLSISNVDLTAEGTSGAGIGAQTSLSSNSYNCTLNVSAAKTVVKAKGTSVSLGNLKSLVLEDGLQFVQPNGAYFDGEDVRDGNGTRVVNQWVIIRGNTSITTGLEAMDNGELTIDSSLPLYNLQGQRVSYPVKGQIYIQNGRKVKF
ncbi:MAG: hypothetical protein J6Z10_00735 [Prevotella sp.]|nr:hypothetical protein [Prevotella sp.]